MIHRARYHCAYGCFGLALLFCLFRWSSRRAWPTGCWRWTRWRNMIAATLFAGARHRHVFRGLLLLPWSVSISTVAYAVPSCA